MIIQYKIAGILLFSLVCLSIKIAVCQENSGQLGCICIDAGHGGVSGKGGDPGAIGAVSHEKNITLGIVLKVGKLINQNYPGIKVVYTRTKDVPVESNKRGKIANDNEADLFISVHINSCKTPGVTGLETYVLGSCRTKESLEVAMKENAVIRNEKDYEKNYSGFDPTSPESYIIFSMLQNVHREKSLLLAGAVQEEMVKETGRVDRGVRQNGYLVLKDATMPAILVEAGFISNRNEERFLNTEAGQMKIARAIYRGIIRYKDEIEKEHKRKVVAEKSLVQTLVVRNTDLQYAIQIASATAKIKNVGRLFSEEEVKELITSGRYRYYVFASEDLEQVKKNLPKVKKKIKDCFIIAIYKGNVISVAEARKLEKK